MPSRFLQAMGIEHRSDEEREARGRAVRTSRHSSRATSSRHPSTKLKTKDRNKSSRSLISATTGSESERRSRKKSSVRSNSGKKRRAKTREETGVERMARRERKDEKRLERGERMTGETGVMEETEHVPSVDDEEPDAAGLGVSTLCDIPQQQSVDVFAFQSDWSDDEDADRRTSKQSEVEMNIPGQYDDHPAEYESATDGHETDHQREEDLRVDDFHLQEHHSDAEHHLLHEANVLISSVISEHSSPQLELPVPAHRSLATSVADEMDDVPTPMPKDFNFSSPVRTMSSGSSFGSTQFSDPHDDAETERSTSPETTFKSQSPLHVPENHEPPTATQPGRDDGNGEAQESPSNEKLASQTLAPEIRQRTIRRRSSHHSRRPELPRHYGSHQQPYQNPWIASQALSPIPPYNPTVQQLAPHIPNYPPAPPPMPMHISPHFLQSQLPRDAAGNPPPLTGYAALATALSPPSSVSTNPASAVFQPEKTLPPLYRRFSSLNHRLLLHLQDELSELEEELGYLDGLDTAARTHPSSQPGRLVIRPASRREAAMGGGEVEWRKADVLGRMGGKMRVYNEMLASFQKTESLCKAREDEVEMYHEYLAAKRPLTEAESDFIDHTEDLVSLATRRLHHKGHEDEDMVMRSGARPQRRLMATAHADEAAHHKHPPRSSGQKEQQQTLFLAALLSVIIPILTFHIIPNFIGRMVVALIVAVGVLVLVSQNSAAEVLALGRKETGVIAGVWGGGMVLLALIA